MEQFFFDILKKYDFSRFWLNFFFLKKIKFSKKKKKIFLMVYLSLPLSI